MLMINIYNVYSNLRLSTNFTDNPCIHSIHLYMFRKFADKWSSAFATLNKFDEIKVEKGVYHILMSALKDNITHVWLKYILYLHICNKNDNWPSKGISLF
jgi:hypothetical protein